MRQPLEGAEITSCRSSGWSALTPQQPGFKVPFAAPTVLLAKGRVIPSRLLPPGSGAQAARQAQPPLAPPLHTAGAPALRTRFPAPPSSPKLQLFLCLSSVPVPHRTLGRVRLSGCGWGCCAPRGSEEILHEWMKCFQANSPYQHSCVTPRKRPGRQRPEATGPRGGDPGEGTALGLESCRGREGAHRRRGPGLFS